MNLYISNQEKVMILKDRVSDLSAEIENIQYAIENPSTVTQLDPSVSDSIIVAEMNEILNILNEKRDILNMELINLNNDII